MNMGVKVKGAKRLSLKLNTLADAVRGDLLLTAANVGALKVVSTAKGKVPVDTGALRDSIRRETRVSEADRAVVAVVAGGDGSHGGRPVGRFVEFGTARTPAHPFLRPSLKEGRADVRRTISGVIGSILRRRFGI